MEMDEHLAMRPEQPFINWLFSALGIRYTFLLPVVTVLAFGLAIAAIAKFKSPALTAVLLAVVPLPLLIGTIGVIDGMVASYQVIVMSGAIPRGSEVAEGGAMSLVSMQVGLILSLPLYLLAIVALCYRAFTHSEVPVKYEEPPIGATLVR
jgi:hypothetical protein